MRQLRALNLVVSQHIIIILLFQSRNKTYKSKNCGHYKTVI